MGKEFYSVYVRHLVIGDNQVRIVALSGILKQFESSGAILCVTHPVSSTTEEVAKDKTNIVSVVDNQNTVWHRS
jgi:hypothetical protein